MHRDTTQNKMTKNRRSRASFSESGDIWTFLCGTIQKCVRKCLDFFVFFPFLLFFFFFLKEKGRGLINGRKGGWGEVKTHVLHTANVIKDGTEPVAVGSSGGVEGFWG